MRCGNVPAPPRLHDAHPVAGLGFGVGDGAAVGRHASVRVPTRRRLEGVSTFCAIRAEQGDDFPSDLEQTSKSTWTGP